MKPISLILLLLSSLLLAACTSSTSTRLAKTSSLTIDAQAEQALNLYNYEDYANAAPLLEALASRPSPEGWEWQLRAADAHLQAGNIEQSRILLEPLLDKMMPADAMLLMRLVQADLMLQTFNPEDALKLLHNPPAAATTDNLQYRYYELTAEAYRLNGNLIESANTLQQLDNMLVADPELRLDNQLAILRTLATMTDTALDLLKPATPGVQSGWMELARLIKLHGQDPGTIDRYIAVWRQQFTDHPAMNELLDGYFKKLGSQYQKASHIAVLLPESGRYKAAAAAIKQGLTAAWFSQPAESRPVLRFYDSSNPENAWPLYTEATQRGADFVIGPLQKSAVTQLLHAGELPVPVLALNQVTTDTVPPDNFFQYSLSPEDEARQVAEHAWINGKRMPVVLMPTSSWGNRIRDAFVKRWESLGGQITEIQSYDAKKSDFGIPIQAMLDIDQSKQRRKRLTKLLGERLEFEPRRRNDVDFIFVAANPVKARQIRPQLQFHHAINLPIYTTSHAWQGFINFDKDRDIEGILFPDMPWLLADEGEEALSLGSFKHLTRQKRSNSFRLVAMGIDSYQLPGHLARLQNSELEAHDGKTGQLYMDQLNKLHRQLIWAQMKNSKPQVIGYAPRLTSVMQQMNQDITVGEEPEAVKTEM
ncbi:MAG: ABC transporter substrate-binding protein [Gammaproteobacteria bacterium]|nr:ABC transporter substrate-binding protein [Gammaproteobacteria bacterium]